MLKRTGLFLMMICFFISVDCIVLVVVGVIPGWLDALLFVDGFSTEELN